MPGRGATIVLCVIALFVGGGFYAFKMRLLGFAQRPGERHNRNTIVVEVPRGSTPDEIAALLEDRGVITDQKSFARWLRFDGLASSLKAGTYELSPSMSPEEIVGMLQRGRDYEVRLTIPEGLRKEEVAAIISAGGFGSVDDIIEVMNDPSLVADFGVPRDVPGGIDGYLFPETYAFAPTTPIDQILKRMRRQLDNVIDNKMRARMEALGWDLHTTLTLAAIIEEETAQTSERAHISSVFHNRLRKGMKLQTDPTVIYGCSDYDGVIKKRHLQQEHPYNTYVIEGLPPGPIAQPGKAAIIAALNPSKSSDLFFVAMGDTGKHVFCADLQCHTTAAQQYLATR